MENDQLLDDVITAEGRPELNQASLGARFGDLIVDGIIINIIQYVLGLGLGGDIAMAILLNLVVYFGYYIAFESTSGQTIGKMLTGTIVVDENGNKIDAGKAALRTLCRIIPFEPFSFFRSSNLGWHDTLSRTTVVKKNSYVA